MNDVLDFLEFFAPFLLLVCVMVFVLALPINFIVSHQCSNFSEITGKQTDYRWFDSCYIETSSGWQRWDEYKLRAAASEGLNALSPTDD